MKLDTKALIEVGKSFLRFMYFGIIALIGTFLTTLVTSPDIVNATLIVGGLSLNVGTLLVGGIGLLLKAIDRYTKYSKYNDLNGIAPSFLQK